MKILQRWVIGWAMLIEGLTLILTFGLLYWNLSYKATVHFARRNGRKSK